MRNSSSTNKNDNLDILVRLGVLEKLVDKLLDRVTVLESTIRANNIPLPEEPIDEWDPDAKPEKETTEKDDVNHILET